MYSKHGGLEMSEIMEKFPEDLKTIYVDVKKSLNLKELMKVAEDLGIQHQKSFMTFIIKHMYDLFIERDVEVLEINPLVLTTDNQLFVRHAKIKIDRDSLYRQ
jgi:succinyl-CoA synthetase beta subunit